jgi:hypothetical protein
VKSTASRARAGKAQGRPDDSVNQASPRSTRLAGETTSASSVRSAYCGAPSAVSHETDLRPYATAQQRPKVFRMRRCRGAAETPSLPICPSSVREKAHGENVDTCNKAGHRRQCHDSHDLFCSPLCPTLPCRRCLTSPQIGKVLLKVMSTEQFPIDWKERRCSRCFLQRLAGLPANLLVVLVERNAL